MYKSFSDMSLHTAAYRCCAHNTVYKWRHIWAVSKANLS